MTNFEGKVNPDPVLEQLMRGGVFVLEPAQEGNLNRAAAHAGFRVFCIDAQRANSKQDLLGALARTFSFPDYFGDNWDALDECIRDLSWLPPGNFALTLRNAAHLLNLGPKDFSTLASILSGATESWKGDGVAFSVVLFGGPDVASALKQVVPL